MLTQQNDDVIMGIVLCQNMWEGLFYMTANIEGLTICGSGFTTRGGELLTPPPPHAHTPLYSVCQNRPWGIGRCLFQVEHFLRSVI